MPEFSEQFLNFQNALLFSITPAKTCVWTNVKATDNMKKGLDLREMLIFASLLTRATIFGTALSVSEIGLSLKQTRFNLSKSLIHTVEDINPSTSRIRFIQHKNDLYTTKKLYNKNVCEKNLNFASKQVTLTRWCFIVNLKENYFLLQFFIRIFYGCTTASISFWN